MQSEFTDCAIAIGELLLLANPWSIRTRTGNDRACSDEAGGEAICDNGSVSEAGFADRFVGAAMETFGDLDIIVNSADNTRDATIQKMTDDART